MRRVLAVTAREIRERWLLFPAGLAIGCVPLVLPAFGVHPHALPFLGVFFALVLAAATAVIVGSSMLARDVANGRLGFLFSRPVPWGTIWGGKWLAALVLVATSGLLAVVPWMAVFPVTSSGRQDGSWPSVTLDGSGWTLLFTAIVLLVGLTNAGATAARSRSAWFAVDLAALLLALGTIRVWLAPLYTLGILRDVPLLPWVVLALALVLASGAQVAVGRTDIRRAHRAMSIAFWSLIFVALVAAGLRLAWARAATPADLTLHPNGMGDPSGRWIYAEALSRRGGSAAFLIDADRGRYVPIGPDRPWSRNELGMVFAADGGSGAILLGGREHGALLCVDLSGDAPGFTEVELESSPPADYGTRLALSASGATALLAHEHGASLFALPSGKREATATVPPGWRPVAVRFLGAQAARVWLIPSVGPPPSPSHREMRILDVEVGREAAATPVQLAASVDTARAWPDLVIPDAEGRRVLTRDGGVRLRDGATGTLTATLVEGAAPATVLFLADGRIVVGEAVGAGTVIRVFDASGAPLDEVALDGVPTGLAVGPEVAPGRVAVRLGSPAGARTLVVDVTGNRVVETLRASEPLGGFFWLGAPQRAQPSTRHFFVEDGTTVLRRDFATGERRVVAGPGAPAGERLSGP